MACIIRRATAEDAEAICVLHKVAVRRLCAGAYSAEQIEAWVGPRVAEDYCKAMSADGETMFVAERASRVAGFASLRGERLLGLYVDPTSGRGLGRPLLAVAEEEARGRGVAILSLQATLNAVPFYRRHGYSVDRAGLVPRSGLKLPVVEMSKTLRTPL
jgi:putative acetyltransferase